MTEELIEKLEEALRYKSSSFYLIDNNIRTRLTRGDLYILIKLVELQLPARERIKRLSKKKSK